MASLYAYSADRFHATFGCWGTGRFGSGVGKGFVIDGGQWRSGWSTLQEEERPKHFGVDVGPYSGYFDLYNDIRSSSTAEDVFLSDIDAQASGASGKGRCYREEWFGGGYANVTREQRDSMTKRFFTKKPGGVVGGVGTLGKREHDDKCQVVGEKRRQAESHTVADLDQSQLFFPSSEQLRMGDDSEKSGDYEVCPVAVETDQMTDSFEAELAKGLATFARTDLLALLDLCRGKDIWKDPLDSMSPEINMHFLNNKHNKIFTNQCRGHLGSVCVTCSNIPSGSVSVQQLEPYTDGRHFASAEEGEWHGSLLSPFPNPCEGFSDSQTSQSFREELPKDSGNLGTDCVKYEAVESHHPHVEKLGSGNQEDPPEAISYALPYMNLRSLLTLEKVSKSMRLAVNGDVLAWQRVQVEPPSSKRLTDEILLKLSTKADGRLKSLVLVECLKVTEAGLQQVLTSNPGLQKLSIPGCTGISAEAIVRMVQRHSVQARSKGLTGIKQLRIKGVYNVTRQNLDVLLAVLQSSQNHQEVTSKPVKPQFYHNGHHAMSTDDDRAIDVESCPKCGNARVVYDYTRERCQQDKAQVPGLSCRGCTFCIARCEECGTCINDLSYEETFSLDLLCSACWLRLPKCSECNKPGLCGRHADHFVRSPDTTFTCGDCCAIAEGPEFFVRGEI